MITLRDYQADAVERMRDGCILCGDVGSGKSRTSLAYYYTQYGGQINTKNYVRMVNPPDLYIITTARKRDTLEWDEELPLFGMSSDPNCSLYSNKVTIDSWNNIAKYTGARNAFFIFDEQRLVGSGAWVKAFYKIAKQNRWILLSATPGDKWVDYIPVFVANGFYRNKTDFYNNHVIIDYRAKYPKIDRYWNDRKLIRLRDKILVDMDFERSTTAHWSDIWCDYDKIEYRSCMRHRWNPYTDEPFKQASEMCYALRRLVNSDESRQVLLLELLEDIPRAIIFYNFDYELDILKNATYGENVEVAEWNGHKHQPIPETDKWVYLVQYTAGCEGWNCIKTDTIIFYSQNYSYKVMEQASGRIARLNTPYKDLYYYRLKSKAPIDLSITRALEAKKQFNERKFCKW